MKNLNIALIFVALKLRELFIAPAASVLKFFFAYWKYETLFIALAVVIGIGIRDHNLKVWRATNPAPTEFKSTIYTEPHELWTTVATGLNTEVVYSPSGSTVLVTNGYKTQKEESWDRAASANAMWAFWFRDSPELPVISSTHKVVTVYRIEGNGSYFTDPVEARTVEQTLFRLGVERNYDEKVKQENAWKSGWMIFLYIAALLVLVMNRIALTFGWYPKKKMILKYGPMAVLWTLEINLLGWGIISLLWRVIDRNLHLATFFSIIGSMILLGIYGAVIVDFERPATYKLFRGLKIIAKKIQGFIMSNVKTAQSLNKKSKGALLTALREALSMKSEKKRTRR